MQENPFTPYFGEVPPVMAGREQVLRDIIRAFNSQSRKPEMTMLVSGARGTGKTALLAYVAQRVPELGWVTADVTALPGMLDDIYERAVESAQGFASVDEGAQVTGIGIGQLISVEWRPPAPAGGNWRTRMNRLIGQLEEFDIGILITVDEVDASLDEMRQLVATYQHFVREQKRVALLMAGLPHSISSLITDKSVSFLRRAQRLRLGRLSDSAIEAALTKTVESAGRSISSSALSKAVDAIGGFPYLLQLVGYRMWEQGTGQIGEADVERAVGLAEREMRDQVLEATYDGLSGMDLNFLRAMLQDDGVSDMRDIANRMGKSSAFAGQYRRRLLESGVIGERGRGRVGFDLPFFREYLQERN